MGIYVYRDIEMLPRLVAEERLCTESSALFIVLISEMSPLLTELVAVVLASLTVLLVFGVLVAVGLVKRDDGAVKRDDGAARRDDGAVKREDGGIILRLPLVFDIFKCLCLSNI